MEKIFASNKKRSILVIGDLMVDEYIIGHVERISPEAPVPVVNKITSYKVLGGAANVVNNLIGLKAKVRIAGIIGNDTNGQFIVKELKRNNIDLHGVYIINNRPTTTKCRIIGNTQQIVRIDEEYTEGIKDEICDKIISYVNKIQHKINAVIFSDYNKGLLTKELIDDLISHFNDNIFILVDPHKLTFDKYKNIDIITPNIEETEHFCGFKLITESDFAKAAGYISSNLSSKYVLITRSSKGMSLYQGNDLIYNIHAKAKQVYDVSGAGDTVIATIAAAISAGDDIYTACELANLAAGKVVEKMGTSIITLNELKIARGYNE